MVAINAGEEGLDHPATDMAGKAAPALWLVDDVDANGGRGHSAWPSIAAVDVGDVRERPAWARGPHKRSGTAAVLDVGDMGVERPKSYWPLSPGRLSEARSMTGIILCAVSLTREHLSIPSSRKATNSQVGGLLDVLSSLRRPRHEGISEPAASTGISKRALISFKLSDGAEAGGHGDGAVDGPTVAGSNRGRRVMPPGDPAVRCQRSERHSLYDAASTA